MERVSDRILDFKAFEKNLFLEACRVARRLMREHLENLDERISETRDTKRYRLVDRRHTTIKTIMGEAGFDRSYYRDRETGRYVFLLDEAIGIGSGYGLASENLAEQVVIQCTDKAFRRAASDMGSLTGQGISAMGAWGIFQRYGDKIGEQEKRLKELGDCGKTGQLGNVQSRVLFEEFDDVWLPMQKEKRKRRGAATERGSAGSGGGGKEKKTGKKPMHVGISYTGSAQSADGRYSNENKMAYASFGDVPEFVSKFETLQNHCYDMDGVERRVTNGDGEKWIRSVAEEHESILQLDPYHRSRAVIKAVSDGNDRSRLFDALGEKDVDKALGVAWELFEKESDDKKRKRLGELCAYFGNNSDILLTWSERGIELPPPPDGVSYRNLGTQEPNNCNLITSRMKRRKGSWSEAGGNNMAKILCYRNTIGLDAILGSLPEPEPAEPWLEPLSAAKSPKHDGEGYGADWLQAPMPFEQASKTHGRDSIRNMFKMQPLSQMAFR